MHETPLHPRTAAGMWLEDYPLDKVRKRKSATDRKAEIVDTVIDLAADIGPDRVTTQHLADRVGVTQPAIFRHFATKSEIWDAVSKKLADDVRRAATDVPHEDGPDTIPAHLGRFFHLVTQYPSLPSILHSRELQAENRDLHKRFQNLRSDRESWIADLVRRGQNNGEHRTDLSPQSVSRMILASVQGLTMHWSLDNHTFDLLQEGRDLAGTLMDSLRKN